MTFQKIHLWKNKKIMKNDPNLYWVAFVHLKNPLNLFIFKQKATKLWNIPKLETPQLHRPWWNSAQLLIYRLRTGRGLLPLQAELCLTKIILSAIGCVILKFVGTSCGLGLG
jgi:hypothetical protein